jgi:nucleotide-binding universal stress UspA family protein
MFRHLLVPTDGSTLSEVAIRMAVGLAKETGAQVTGVHVMHGFHGMAFGSERLADTEERFDHSEREHADNYLGVIERASREAGVACDTVVATHAHTYEAIIGVAEKQQCDLIVMASHGRRGVRALLIGSETQKVLTHSGIPVLVVRESGEGGRG